MTSPVPIQLMCPCCGLEFDDDYGELVTVSGGGFCADFRTGFSSSAHSISETFLYSCDHCGFTERTVMEWFERPVSSDLQEFIHSTIKRQYQDRSPSQDATPGKYSKFERYARIQEFRGADPFDLGQYYLRAGWTTNTERCQAIALSWFKKALNRTGCVAEVEAPLVAYLAGETSRKLGEHEEAQYYFNIADQHLKPEMGSLKQMVQTQMTEPIETPYWQFGQFVLDPLSYFHSLMVISSADKLKGTNQRGAFELYQRAYQICEATLERHVSLKMPNLPLAYRPDSGQGAPTNYYDSALSTLSRAYMENPNGGGFWVDSALIGMGRRALEGWHDLREASNNEAEVQRIDLTHNRITSRLQAIESARLKREAEKQLAQTAPEQTKPVKGINSIVAAIFVIFLIVLSLASAFITSLIYQALHQIVSFWKIAACLAGSVAAGYAFSAVLRFVGGLKSTGSKATSLLSRSSGWLGGVGGIVLLYVIAGWPGIVSTAVLSGLLIILTIVFPAFGKRAK